MKILIFISFLLGICNSIQAAERLKESCRKSFNIESIRIIEINNQSLSCKNLEEAKNTIYNNFDHDSYDYIMDNIDETQKNLETIEKLIRNESFNAEHRNLLIATTGKAIAAIGLEACIGTAGAGCIAAAIGGGLALYSQGSSILDYGRKAEEVTRLKNRLLKAKASLSRHKNHLPTGYSNAVRDFNQICKTIESHCLK